MGELELEAQTLRSQCILLYQLKGARAHATDKPDYNVYFWKCKSHTADPKKQPGASRMHVHCGMNNVPRNHTPHLLMFQTL